MSELMQMTEQNKTYYTFQEDMKALSWVKPTTTSWIAYINQIWASSPLLGEYKIPDDMTKEIMHQARNTIAACLRSPDVRLSTEDNKSVVLAAIYAVQDRENKSDSEDQADCNEKSFWDTVIRVLAPKVTDTMFSKVRLIICHCIKDAFDERDRYFAPERSHQYYNTINAHAMSPDRAIYNLLELLYLFYRDNLLSSYTPGDAAYRMFVSGINQRWSQNQKKRDDDEQAMRIRSLPVSSSIKYLFMNRQEYMAYVCDTLVGKLDYVLKNGTAGLSEDSRWDIQLREWYDAHTDTDKQRMAATTRQAVLNKIYDKSETLKCSYTYEREHLAIAIPAVRLGQLDNVHKLHIELFQCGSMVYEKGIRPTGSSLCWNSKKEVVTLQDQAGIDWNAPFQFEVRICCDQTVLSTSGKELYRTYMLFDSLGRECRNLRVANELCTLLACGQDSVQVNDLDDESYRIDDTLNLWRIDTSSVITATVKGIDLLRAHAVQTKLRCIPTRKPIQSADFYFVDEQNEKHSVFAFDSQCQLRVILPDQIPSHNFQILHDGERRPLYQYEDAAKCIAIPLLNSPEQIHTVILRDLKDGNEVYRLEYVVFPDFSYQLNHPYYLNNNAHDIIATVCVNGDIYQNMDSLQADEERFCISLPDCEVIADLKLPVVAVSMQGVPLYQMQSFYWYEDVLNNSFIQVTAPDTCQTDIYVSSTTAKKKLRMVGADYDLPNHIAGHDQRIDTETFFLRIITPDGSCYEHHLFDIHYKARLLESPLRFDDEGLLIWQPDPTAYVGPIINKKETPFILYTNDGAPYPIGFKGERLWRVDEYGQYPYHVNRVIRNRFANVEELVYEGTLTREMPLSERFNNVEIALTSVLCTTNDGSVKDLRLNPLTGIIRRIQLVEDDDTQPIWQGELCFEYMGVLRPYAYMTSMKYAQINPITFCICDDRIVISTSTDDQLLVDVQKMQFCSFNDDMIKQQFTFAEQAHRLLFAEDFGYEEREARQYGAV